MKKSLFRFLSFFILISVVSFTSPYVSAQTSLPTAAKGFDVTINDIRAVNGMVEGTLRITNPNGRSYGGLSYTQRLLGADIVQTKEVNGEEVTVISSGPLITYKNAPTFRLGAGQSIDFPIAVPYSTAVTSGIYFLQIAVSDNNAKLLGITKQPVELKGTGSFVRMDTCFIVADGEKYSPAIGPNVKPKSPVYGTCEVTNPSSTELLVYPRSTYAVNQVVGHPDSEKKTVSSESSITIPAGGTKEVQFPLPQLETPQVYEALSILVDSQNQQVSPQVAFRWVVAGPSAAIRSVTLDALSYEKGQTAKVTVAADPSMDLYWRAGGPKIMTFPPPSTFPPPPTKLNGTPLTDPKLLVTVTDKNGGICGEAEKKSN
jgi:hypothetical protein